MQLVNALTPAAKLLVHYCYSLDFDLLLLMLQNIWKVPPFDLTQLSKAEIFF